MIVKQRVIRTIAEMHGKPRLYSNAAVYAVCEREIDNVGHRRIN